MYTQKNIESIQRDSDILKLIGGLQNNVRGLKDIIDYLTTRIEKLEKGKNENK
jgi:hypothetical protein